MELRSHWVHATRPDWDRIKRESMYTERLLSLCGNVLMAQHIKEDWIRAGKPPFHSWNTYNYIARVEAMTGLLPSESRDAHFVVEFTDEIT